MSTVTKPIILDETGQAIAAAEQAIASELARIGGNDCVHYSSDTGKSDAQKATARTNIGAAKVTVNDTSATSAKMTRLNVDGTNYALAGVSSEIYDDYSDFVTAFNSKAAEELENGTVIWIRTRDVPDLWVSSNNESTSVPYVYTTDAQFVSDLRAATSGLQVGYYKIDEHEGDKAIPPVQDVKRNNVSVVSNGVASLDGLEAKATVKTAIDATLAEDTFYKLGTVSTLEAALPATGSDGAAIEILLTATANITPAITGTVIGETLPTIESGKIAHILYEWLGTWCCHYEIL